MIPFVIECDLKKESGLENFWRTKGVNACDVSRALFSSWFDFLFGTLLFVYFFFFFFLSNSSSSLSLFFFFSFFSLSHLFVVVIVLVLVSPSLGRSVIKKIFFKC